RRAGGGFSVSPRAVITDGLLDLMIMPESDKGLLSLISDYYHMSRSENPGDIQYAQLPWLDLSTREPIHLNIDGEPVNGKEFRFKLHKQKLLFCLPADSPILHAVPAEPPL
ncbi:MAG: hypothetical protein R6U50_03930, partial [Desulfobacterales bacterium]